MTSLYACTCTVHVRVHVHVDSCHVTVTHAVLSGYYCDNTATAIGSLAGYECPRGSFCPNGTESATQHLCPPGTYNNRTSLYAEEFCQPCLPGFYCQNAGRAEPEGLCYPG